VIRPARSPTPRNRRRRTPLGGRASGEFSQWRIDSSIITALAARKSQRQLLTFSIGFKQAAYDETRISSEVASRYGTAHHRIELDDDETR